MRISLNLATRPFVEIRPLLARLRLAMLLLLVAAFGLGLWAHNLADRAALATAEMDRLKQQTAAVTAERARNERRMREPGNAGVLERARFLNALFAEKSFSWTAVMMDLERVLPAGVQVTSIEPNITKTGDVLIRLRVTGDRDRAVQLVRNLEGSGRFAGPRLAGETSLTPERAKALSSATTLASAPGTLPAAPGTVQTISSPQGTGTLLIGNGVEFEIFSGYIPLPERIERRRAQAVDTRDEMVPDLTEMMPPSHNRHTGAKRSADILPTPPLVSAPEPAPLERGPRRKSSGTQPLAIPSAGAR